MIDDERGGFVVTPQAVVGLLIVLFGVLLLMGNLGWVNAGTVLSFWPLGVLALGASMYRRAVDPAAKFSAGVVVVIGAWLTLARVLHFSGFSGALIFPLILVGIGAALISRAWRSQSGSPGVSDQVVSDFAFWSGIERRISSPVFRRADFTAVMGGIEADLRQAGTGGDTAVIDVFVVMGGLEIRVPPDWVVSNQIVAIMGGAVDKSTGTRDAKHKLIIRGFVLMGGVEVKS